MRKFLYISINVLIIFCLCSCSKKSQAQSDGYIITEYMNETGSQYMFYTITSPTGKLIVIDGGTTDNTEKVREVIQKKGNTVDCWILTHPHPDHIGAFNTIYSNPGNIKINDIYTVNLDYNKYFAKQSPCDDVTVYRTFLDQTANDKRIHYLYRGDHISLIGLDCTVFNSYDNIVDSLSNDLCNDGSLMLKLKNQNESILFCADVGSIMSDTIIKQFGDQLPSDYIQMGHHGNGGLSENFYKMVKPKVAIFDAPKWLLENKNPDTNETYSYTTPKNRSLMESIGCKILDYTTAPNQITLK